MLYENPGKPEDKLSEQASAPNFAPTPFFSACKKHGCLIR